MANSGTYLKNVVDTYTNPQQNYWNFSDYLKNELVASPFENPKLQNITTSTAAPNQIIEQQKIPTMIKQKIIVVDSRDRDTARFPDSNRFQVTTNTSSQFHLNDMYEPPGYASRANTPFPGATLEDDIKNVRYIKLEECVVPDFTGDHPYLLLRIPELLDVVTGTNDSIRRSFATLVPERVHGSYVSCKTSLLDLCQKTFEPPLAKLVSFTMEFMEPGTAGTLYDFPGNAETMSVLKVCHEIPNKQQIFNQIIT